MPYLDSLDIANRALQHCGAPSIKSPTEDSKANTECAFAYDKVRRAELQRNTWSFAVKKAVLRPVDTDTMILDPSAWVSTKTYLPGSIVEDANSQLWISMRQNNINNEPDVTDAWDMYFGPLTVDPFDAEEAYSAGELVYKPGSVAGSYGVFLSLVNANSDVPDTATAYDATVTYHGNAIVSYLGSQWRSLIEVNLGITPADGPLPFDATAIYSIGQTVTGSDDFIYSSVASANTGHDPVTDAGIHWTNTTVANAWSRSPTMTASSSNWRRLDAEITTLNFAYPVGAGPLSQGTSRNVFRLPAGYLRTAPQDPKGGAISYLGAPGGSLYSDWDYDGDYIISGTVSPIILRFVADVTQVSKMNDMFCEGLACRVALAVCEPITQSSAKVQSIASEYNKFMGEARTVNAIEQGTTQLPIDDYIACRA